MLLNLYNSNCISELVLRICGIWYLMISLFSSVLILSRRNCKLINCHKSSLMCPSSHPYQSSNTVEPHFTHQIRAVIKILVTLSLIINILADVLLYGWIYGQPAIWPKASRENQSYSAIMGVTGFSPYWQPCRNFVFNTSEADAVFTMFAHRWKMMSWC